MGIINAKKVLDWVHVADTVNGAGSEIKKKKEEEEVV